MSDTPNKEVHATGIKLSLAVLISLGSALVGAGGTLATVAVAYGYAQARMDAQDETLTKHSQRIESAEMKGVRTSTDVAVLQSQIAGMGKNLEDLQLSLEKLDEKLNHKLDRLLERQLPTAGK